MPKITCFVLLICLSFLHAAAQQHKGFPEDLNTAGLVFLKYEQLQAVKDSSWKAKKQYKIRKKWALEANEELKEFSKKYPFKNTVVTREVSTDSLLNSGYKYRLNCDILDRNNQGIAAPDPYSAQVAPLYIENLKTKEVYLLFEIKQSPTPRSYGYAALLKKFHERLKKRF